LPVWQVRGQVRKKWRRRHHHRHTTIRRRSLDEIIPTRGIFLARSFRSFTVHVTPSHYPGVRYISPCSAFFGLAAAVERIAFAPTNPLKLPADRYVVTIGINVHRRCSCVFFIFFYFDVPDTTPCPSYGSRPVYFGPCFFHETIVRVPVGVSAFVFSFDRWRLTSRPSFRAFFRYLSRAVLNLRSVD